MPDRKYAIRSWCNKLKSKDIICLQEIKTIGYHAFNTLKFIWDKATCLYSGHQRGKGGVALLINLGWMSYIIEHNFSPSHRAIWVIFNINGVKVGICNIYAPNDYRARESLWDWLAINLPDANWIVLGDFNMVENSQDKKGDS